MRWEYKTLKLKPRGLLGGKLDEVAVEQQLNELGQQGWELVTVLCAASVHGQTRDILAVLKRSR